MSDPVTNAEVEDVLSSIRRLVSEDKRPISKPRPDPVPGRLVLTPSLRVAEESRKEEVAKATSDDGDAVPEEVGADETHRQVSPISADQPGEELEPEQPTHSDDPNMFGSEEVFDAVDWSDNTDTFVYDTGRAVTGEESAPLEKASTDPATADEANTAEITPAETTYDEGPAGAAKADESKSDEAKPGEAIADEVTAGEVMADEVMAGEEISSLDPATGAGPDLERGDTEAEAEKNVVSPESASVSDIKPARDEPAETVDAQPAAGAPEAQEPTPETGSGNRVFSLSSKIAALETAIARIPGEWEPDGAGKDANAGTPAPSLDWKEHVELDGRGRPMRPAADAKAEEPEAREQAADENELLGGEEQLIDEEALRDLVAEIVRSELQGELGERITRNVRKLVRREIHRALAAQELE